GGGGVPPWNYWFAHPGPVGAWPTASGPGAAVSPALPSTGGAEHAPVLGNDAGAVVLRLAAARAGGAQAPAPLGSGAGAGAALRGAAAAVGHPPRAPECLGAPHPAHVGG